jgi:hypothetical protein
MMATEAISMYGIVHKQVVDMSTKNNVSPLNIKQMHTCLDNMLECCPEGDDLLRFIPDPAVADRIIN